MSYADNWNFSEKYIPSIKTIIAKHANHIVNIEIAEPEADMKYATDMIVEVNNGHVAVRIRRSVYSYRDLTIRSYKNGYKTELDKLKEGYADWYLYAWENKTQSGLAEYILIDLEIARPLFFMDLQEKTNNDGTKFVIIPIPYLKQFEAIKAHEILEAA